MLTALNPHSAVCLGLIRAIGQTRTVEEIYAAALEALASGLGVERSSILLFDADGVMRFKAARGLSAAYRAAVEGHSPWHQDTTTPEPIVVPDVTAEASLGPYQDVLAAEGIAALAFVPLVSLDRVIGKFMLYYGVPHTPTEDDLQLTSVIAAQVAFAVERTRTEEQARRSEERLRFALDAASMGTWDWDLRTNRVVWSDNLEKIHGLPAGTFDGTFSSYEREIHPDDRDRVFASVQRALAEGEPHDVEYRIVAPDGTVRWCEGKGRVEYEGGRPVRMSGVCMMVTRRKEAELARLAAAEEANRMKDDFLATLSHELRTPLNAILGWVQLLQQDALPAQRKQGALDIIARNARLQAQLIEDILDVSRIISGTLEIERGSVSVPALVETAVAGLLPMADARRITVSLRISESLPPIEGDARRLHQVLGNVLSNALKFTPESGQVAISCDAADATVRIVIEDSGIGIPGDFLPYVFERFRQADSRPTRRHGGLGLGLAIARHLVERHRGRIEVHSDGVNRGTRITISLPALTAGAASPSTAPPNETCTPDLCGTSILIVDDQDDSRDLLAAVLERHGANVLAADSAAAALEVVARERIELLIADIAMPGRDGFQLLEDLRAAGNDTPAIAVTACTRADDRQHATRVGYGGYCAKPVDEGQLLTTIRSLLGD